jgi:hypothetical protein
MTAYIPPGWPTEVHPPGSEEFEASAVGFPVKFTCSAGPAASALLGRLLCRSRFGLFPPATART